MRALGFFLAALAVALGAFGAHALKATLPPDRLVTWETAVRYQMYAAIGLQVSSYKPGQRLLALGALIFSGSLYLLCLTGMGWLGAITPLGGLSLIAGYLLLGRDALQRD
ncbi:DUF423 domain-containing protein [bacterium]|nr:DUF423 domain-containing protein [bacterium]